MLRAFLDILGSNPIIKYQIQFAIIELNSTIDQNIFGWRTEIVIELSKWLGLTTWMILHMFWKIMESYMKLV